MSHHSSAFTPKRIPSHEKRERWVAVISASFQPGTVFHFARHRALKAVDLMDDLDAEIVDMNRRLAGYIPATRLLAFWKGVFHMLKTLSDGYYEILTRLANFEWTWWVHEDEDRRTHLRTRKQSMIKHLATYDWILSILQIAVEASFQEARPWFLISWPRRRNVITTQRRCSCSETLKPSRIDSAEVTAIELSILHWTQDLEEELRTTMQELQAQYDRGKVFEHYVRNLQWTIDKERTEWEEDKKEHREYDEKMWPFPNKSLRPEGLDVLGSEQQQRHFPVSGIPTWQEDEDLQTMFS